MHGGDVWREGAPGDWLDFSANIRPDGPPDWVKDALLAGIDDVSYYPDLRMERARSALGEYLELDPDWVLPTAGGISAIALAMRLDAPEVAVFGPCFGEYAEIAADCGVKLRELSLLSGREGIPEASPSVAPTSASREMCEPGELSTALCEGAPTSRPMNVPCEGRESSEQSEALCGGVPAPAPTSAPCKGREASNQSEALCENAPTASPMNVPCKGRESSEQSEALCGGVLASAPTSVPCEGREVSNQSEALCEDAPAARPMNVPREGRESSEQSEALCGGVLASAPTSVPCGDCEPGELCATSRGGASSAPSSPSSSDRHALAAPSEVLRGNMTPGAAVWLCNPLNPVGVAFPRAEIEALLGIVESAGGWLVLDEAFVHCCPERTSADLLADHPRLAIVGSLTKSLGIPGARAGYVCANPEVLGKLARRQRSWELNCFAESVIRALPDHAAELRAESAINAARREALRRDLEALGAYVYPSEACFLLADFGRDVAPIAARLREKGILVRQCADFHGIDDGRHLRLAVKEEAANARLIEALWEALGA